MSCFQRPSRAFRAAYLLVLVACVSLAAGAAMAQRVVELATLAPESGFRIDGLADGDLLGISSDGIGDFNGDGLDDVLVSAEEA